MQLSSYRKRLNGCPKHRAILAMGVLLFLRVTSGGLSNAHRKRGVTLLLPCLRCLGGISKTLGTTPQGGCGHKKMKVCRKQKGQSAAKDPLEGQGRHLSFVQRTAPNILSSSPMANSQSRLATSAEVLVFYNHAQKK